MASKSPTRQRARRLPMFVLLALAVALGLAAGVLWHGPLERLLGREDVEGHPGATTLAATNKQLWTCGMHPQVIREEPGLCPICQMELTPVQTDSSGTGASSGERKVKYWWDPMMNPPYVSNEPGTSPMGMSLIPVYEDEIMAGSSVTIDPAVVQNMGVRIAPVTEGPVEVTIRATGYLMEPDPNHIDVNLRVGGWIENLYANIDGMRINKGDPLFDLYSPEIQVAVDELIAARKALAGDDASDATSNASRLIHETAIRKLENWGLSKDQIEELAQLHRAPRTVTFFSPMTGHVTEKRAYAGAAVEAGQMALRLADNSTMWLDIRVFEHQLPRVSIGQHVKATVQAVPGKEFEGEVIFVHPHLDEMTRTALVRIAIPNPDLVLRQEMFATVHLRAEVADRAIVIPREAVIDTGERQVAFVATSGGHFEPRRVEMGARTGDGMVQILSGLAPGEAVVTSGQFLLDSESRLKEAIQKHLNANLLQPPNAPEAAPPEPKPELLVGAWTPEVDALVSEYLKVASILGEKQTVATPQTVNVETLIAAAHRLAEQSAGELDAQAQPVTESARQLAGQPIDQQRETFKKVSDAMIALVQRVPPSQQVAETLFIAHCPMAPGNWLQTKEEIANPYYATTMKACGEIKGSIATMERRP